MTDELPKLLRALDRGDARASAELLPLVYAELRALAARKLAQERPGATLQATALVHEAYLRLAGAEGKWESAAHFYGAAAEAIRRILIERARARNAVKRGGGARPVTLDEAALLSDEPSDELLDLDEALTAFAQEDARKARLVELRYFAGLSLEEAARVLEISPATADRDWAFARAWLHAWLQGDAGVRRDASEKRSPGA